MLRASSFSQENGAREGLAPYLKSGVSNFNRTTQSNMCFLELVKWPLTHTPENSESKRLAEAAWDSKGGALV